VIRLSAACTLIVVATMLLVALPGHGAERPALEIVRADGHVVWRAPIDEGERFDLVFIHSQERSPWAHHYVAGAGRRIVQTASTFSALGAGMPAHAPTRLTSSRFTTEMPLDIGVLEMIHSTAAAFTIQHRGRDIPLASLLDDFDRFAIRIR
jgi:hypothetical protein